MSGPDVHNEVSGIVTGLTVQAGSVFGGVNVHPHIDRVVPRQLPAGVPQFVGRADELDALGENATKAAITVISGMPGVGKTTLAVHWGRRHLDRFPDGQLYVNLRGFDPTAVPMHPAEAIRGFLDAFHLPVAMIPAEFSAQAALYRSVVAGKCMLILLDNAHDSDQLRSLLPGGSASHVLVTSRRQLPSLVACEQARHITLEPFSTDEARKLLVAFFSAHRVHTETAAVDDLIHRCARLPIALTIAAARAVMNPHARLSTLATELAELSTGDSPATDIRAVFSWSYVALPSAAARLFRLIGLHTGPDIDVHAAASLAGVPIARTHELLTTLTTAHLLHEHASGRYRFHDLLRAYAADRAAEDETEPCRTAALRRLLDYYVHTGLTADRRINPDREPIVPDAAQEGVTATEIANDGQAWEWFTTEHPTLLAIINQAGDSGFDEHAWQLAWVMATFLDRRGHWHDCAATHEVALAAVARLGDRRAQARTHRFLGWAYTRLGRYRQAHTHLQHALTLWRDLAEPGGQATAYHGLSLLDQWQEGYAHALDNAERALELYRAQRDVTGEATALNACGWNHARLGNHRHAMAEAQLALNLFTQLGDHFGQAEALDTLGYTHLRTAHYDDARSYYQDCLTLRRDLGDHYLTASALIGLGEAYQATRELDAARDAWHQALAILQDLGHPDADRVHLKLRDLV